MQNAQGEGGAVLCCYAGPFVRSQGPRITSNLPSESGRIGENEICVASDQVQGEVEEIIFKPKLELKAAQEFFVRCISCKRVARAF